jgi:hypothetical protein
LGHHEASVRLLGKARDEALVMPSSTEIVRRTTNTL